MPLRLTARLARHPFVVGLTAVVATALLAVPFIAMPPDGTASQEPSGEVFEARDLVDERLPPGAFVSFFIVEARGGDPNLLSADGLAWLRDRADDVRSDPAVAPELLRWFDPATQRQVTGLWTVADRVDAALAEDGLGGLDEAPDDAVRATASAIVDDVGPVSLGLSRHAERDAATGWWTTPALTVTVLADNAALGGGGGGAQLGADDTTKEEYARDVQAALRGDGSGASVWGVAIDTNLTSAEQGEAAGPFIGFTILAVLLLVGVTFRSYWVVAITGAALTGLIVWLFGLSNLVGFSEDQILSTIVPIALVSFGVDFAFHAVGRYREQRRAGGRPAAALTTGLGAVGGALILALASDTAAFLSNVSSGIESIVQFGIAAAFGLVAAFLLLGIVTPVVLSGIEQRVPAHTGRGARALSVAGVLAAASTAMGAVLLAVFLAPAAGVALLGGYVLVFIVVPGWLGGRRAADDAPGTSSSVAGGHATAHGPGAELIATTMAAVARRWAVVLPVTALVTVAAAFAAVQVPTEFDVRDFFAADTDFVVGLDKLDEHVGGQGGEPAVVAIEADLTEPTAVAALARFADEVQALDSPRFARTDDGDIDLDTGVVGLLREAVATPPERLTAGGVQPLTDTDGDGLPDARDQLAAFYDDVVERGLPYDDERLAWLPAEAREVVWTDGAAGMTRMVLGLPGTRAVENVNAALEDLQPAVAALESTLTDVDPGARVVVTGAPIVRAASLDAITTSLQRSLPLAVLLCLVVAAAFMRSIRYALISVVPILLVVSWLYALMYVWGFSINLVTATIGAISIGIGIDFAIHLVMRYREELAATGDRAAALGGTGEGTGTALVASAASSIVGFAILAFAPMPLFASYGLLTAVMIALALLATFLVLPPLLWLTTRPDVHQHRDRPVGADGSARPSAVRSGTGSYDAPDDAEAMSCGDGLPAAARPS